MSNAGLSPRMEKGFDIAQAVAEADRCLLCYDPPCSRGCPAETDPGAFIRKLRLHNVTGAIRTIKVNNILGGACGRWSIRCRQMRRPKKVGRTRIGTVSFATSTTWLEHL